MSDKASKGLFEILSLMIISHKKKEHALDKSFELLRYEESLFDSGIIRGQLIIQDSNDIVKTLPIIGGERLVFKYKVSKESPPIQKNFIIYKYGANEDPSKQRNAYTFHFVSEEYVHSANMCISRSYKDKTIKFIVEDIFKEISQKTKSKLIASPTKGKHHIIIPRYSPLEAINLVASMCHHESYKSGLFYFFENSYGFNFNCIEAMLSAEPISKFQSNRQNIDTGVREKTASLVSIAPYSANTDLINSMRRGMFANKFICYDPIAKKHKEVTYSYKKNFSDTKHLNRFQLDNEVNEFVSPDQKIAYFPSNSLRKKVGYYKSKTDSMAYSNDFEEIVHYNNSVMEQLFVKQYALTIKGDDVPALYQKKPKFFTVGEVIEIDSVTKSADENKKNQPNTYVKGKYLIHWCEHIFRKEGYVVNARVLSDTNSRDHEK